MQVATKNKGVFVKKELVIRPQTLLIFNQKIFTDPHINFEPVGNLF